MIALHSCSPIHSKRTKKSYFVTVTVKHNPAITLYLLFCFLFTSLSQFIFLFYISFYYLIEKSLVLLPPHPPQPPSVAYLLFPAVLVQSFVRFCFSLVTFGVESILPITILSPNRQTILSEYENSNDKATLRFDL